MEQSNGTGGDQSNAVQYSQQQAEEWEQTEHVHQVIVQTGGQHGWPSPGCREAGGGGGLPASPCFGATQSMSLEVTGIWEVRGVGVGVAGRVSMISPGVVGEKEGKPGFFLLSFSTALSQPS